VAPVLALALERDEALDLARVARLTRGYATRQVCDLVGYARLTPALRDPLAFVIKRLQTGELPVLSQTQRARALEKAAGQPGQRGGRKGEALEFSCAYPPQPLLPEAQDKAPRKRAAPPPGVLASMRRLALEAGLDPGGPDGPPPEVRAQMARLVREANERELAQAGPLSPAAALASQPNRPAARVDRPAPAPAEHQSPSSETREAVTSPAGAGQREHSAPPEQRPHEQAQALWERILPALEDVVHPLLMERMVAPTRGLSCEGERLRVGTPDPAATSWLGRYLQTRADRLATTLSGRRMRVEWVVAPP